MGLSLGSVLGLLAPLILETPEELPKQLRGILHVYGTGDAFEVSDIIAVLRMRG